MGGGSFWGQKVRKEERTLKDARRVREQPAKASKMIENVTSGARTGTALYRKWFTSKNVRPK